MQSSSHIKTELSKKDKKETNMDTLSKKFKTMLKPRKSTDERPASSVTQIGQPEVIVITVTEFRY